jgi:hypothetical protein
MVPSMFVLKLLIGNLASAFQGGRLVLVQRHVLISEDFARRFRTIFFL